MKSITEFTPLVLQKVLTNKTALTAEGKTPEEISTAIGESFKWEGDKLKYAIAASDLVDGKTSIRRVMVATFAEGETVPPKYQKIDDTYYLVENLDTTKFVIAPAVKPGRGGGGPRKSGPGGPKSSPWGASPEELAAKKKSSAAAAQSKK